MLDLAGSRYAVIKWCRDENGWVIAQGGFDSYRAASDFAGDLECKNWDTAMVRREPVVFPDRISSRSVAHD